jgi:hypothetical protein
MLSMSLLIFGLGAAALLRAAHESFASNSSWRAAPEVPFAQHPETTPAVLATLRVEPTATERTNEVPRMIAADPQPSPNESASSEQIAALEPTETPAAETAKPADAPVSMEAVENPPVPEAAPVEVASSAGEATTATDTRKPAAASDTAPVDSEPAAVQAEPTTSGAVATTAIAPEASTAAMKIATLGGPPVDIAASETRATKSDRAKPDQSAIKKRVQARRTIRRRRFAARTRLLVQQQQQANPFGQPQSFAPAAPRQ